MRIEKTPHIENLDFNKYIECFKKDGIDSFLQETDKRYFYWSEIKHRPNLQFESPEKAWEAIKSHRFISARNFKKTSTGYCKRYSY
jgi:hypothetical protein